MARWKQIDKYCVGLYMRPLLTITVVQSAGYDTPTYQYLFLIGGGDIKILSSKTYETLEAAKRGALISANHELKKALGVVNEAWAALAEEG